MPDTPPPIPPKPNSGDNSEENTAASTEETSSEEKRTAASSEAPSQKKETPPTKEKEETSAAEKSKSGGSGRSIFVGFFAVILGLFCVFYSLLLWGLLSGNLSNPLFTTLGVEPQQLKDVLLQVTNSVFGFFALLFLIMMLIKFFQWVMISKKHPRKKSYGQRTGIFLFVLLVVISAWVALYLLILNAKVEIVGNQIHAENSLIVTDPANTIGISVPKTIKFDIAQKLYERIDQQYVRQILWDLNGDGEYGDAAGSVVTYRYQEALGEEGRFTVRAKVIYFSPNSNEEKEFVDVREIIVLNEAAQAKITAEPLMGQVPLTVNLSAADSVDPDGSIVQYEWDLDDDENFEISGETESQVQTVLTTVGDHTIRLRVTGQNNDYDVAEVTITALAADEKIRAEITSPDASFSGIAPFEITLSGEKSFSKEGGIVEYEWDISGEEKTVLGRKIQREFTDPGTYEVTLTVTNADEERDQETVTIEVFEKREVVIQTAPPIPEEGPLRGTAPFEVTFDASASEVPRAVEWRWDFESDGIIDDFSQQTTHVFRDPKTYTVSLTIVDSANQEFESTQKVVVDPINLIPRISAEPSSGTVPLTVDFDGSGSTVKSDDEIIDFIWEFPGEDPIHYRAKISYEFRRVGVFPVKMTILTAKGQRASTDILVSVRAQPLEAAFSASPVQGDAPLEVSFNPLDSTGNVQEYLWNFGDGETSRKILTTHTYQTPGEYTVRLRITNGRGVVSEATKTITVTGDE